MKVKRVFLLSLFVVLAANAWTLDLRAIAYRAFKYLGSPMPEKAVVRDDGVGIIIDKKNGNYSEEWVFQLNENKRVKLAGYCVFDSNRNNLNTILSDFETQVYIQGYRFLGADEDFNMYATNDGPFSMCIIICNSIGTDRPGALNIVITFINLVDM